MHDPEVFFKTCVTMKFVDDDDGIDGIRSVIFLSSLTIVKHRGVARKGAEAGEPCPQ